MTSMATTRKQSLEEQIRRERRAVLVVNTHSRHGARAYGRARDLLAKHGFTLDASYPVRDPVRLQEIVHEVVAEGHRLIVIGGGDGTLSSVVDEFAHRDVVVGLLPLGTANSFARTIGLPLSLDGAVQAIAQGKVADIDLALVNQDYFLNTAALGISASVARATPAWLKRHLGALAYGIIGAAKFPSHRPFRCRITEDGRVTELDALQVILANGRYHGGVLVAHRADVESRDVLVQIVTAANRWNLVRAWLGVARGRPLDMSIAHELTVRDAVLETDTPQYVSVDGEVTARTPIRISIAAEALKLMVPLEFQDRD